jgi:hypothetical protein
MNARRLFVLVVLFACIAGGPLAAQAVTLDNFAEALASIPVANSTRILAALDDGLKSSCCGFPADETLRLVKRLASASGTAADKEAILLVITQAIEQDLPIDSLLNKANEGLARGVALSSLRQLLAQRLDLLEESRDLFYVRGIFRASPGASVAAGAAALPSSRFDALLSNLGDALGDYLESGGSPFGSQKIYEEVQARLTLLAGSVLAAEDVELLLSRIGAEDLKQVVLAVVS